MSATPVHPERRPEGPEARDPEREPQRPLVVCPACERPQFPRAEGCISCGGPLPAPAAAPAPNQGKDKLLDAYEPFLEGSFGEAGMLLLSQRRLEWKPPCEVNVPGKAYALAELDFVQLQRRPVWEALLFALPALGLAALAPWAAVRWGLAAVACLAALACATQRRYALFVRTKSGKDPLSLLLGIGRASSGRIARAVSVWETFSPELSSRGVRVAGPAGAAK